MSVMGSRLFLVGMLVGAVGCLEADEEEEDGARDPGGETAQDAGTPRADAATGGTSRSGTGSNAAATEVQLGRDVWVGAFKLSLRTAKLKRTSANAPGGTITVDFGAENLTEGVGHPFGDCRHTAPRLELGGETLYATCNAPLVPALARGEGVVTFLVDDYGAAAADLPTASLRIGDEESNEVDVPFAKLEETVGFPNVPATVNATPFAYRNATVAIERALVSYSDWWRNWLCPEGMAHLLVELSIGPVTSTSGRWSEADLTLLRPDGVSVTTPLNHWVDVGYQGDLLLPFEVKAPVSGTYTLTFNLGTKPVTQTIVVP